MIAGRFTGAVVFLSCLMIGSPGRASAEETPAAEAPAAAQPAGRTTADPTLPVDELRLRLKPLDRTELAVEAVAWLEILKSKVREISNTEIAVKYKNAEIDKAKTAAQKADKARLAGSGEKAGEALAEARAAAAEAEAASRRAEGDDEAREATASALRTDDRATTPGASPAAIASPGAAAPDTAGDHRVTTDTAISVDADSIAGGRDLSRAALRAEQAAGAKAEVKERLLEKLADLRTEKTAISDRFNAVLDELELKGGDAAEHRQYIAAVSGLTVDVTDASAAWSTLTGWLRSPEGGMRWAVNLAKFIAILLLGAIASRLAGRIARKAVSRTRRISGLLADFIVNSVRRVVLIMGLIVAVTALEVNVGPVLALIGAAGFVIGFALQDTLGNFASGLMILLYRPFDVGDSVEVAGASGKVESMNLVSTTIKTFDNKAMIVPNNSIWGDVITNVTGSPTRRVDLVFGVGYNDDIGRVQALLEELVAQHPLALRDPEPTIRLNELADSSVNFICRPWAKTADYWTVYWDLTRQVKERFDAEGISIPFPQRDVHLIKPKE